MKLLLGSFITILSFLFVIVQTKSLEQNIYSEKNTLVTESETNFLPSISIVFDRHKRSAVFRSSIGVFEGINAATRPHKQQLARKGMDVYTNLGTSKHQTRPVITAPEEHRVPAYTHGLKKIDDARQSSVWTKISAPGRA